VSGEPTWPKVANSRIVISDLGHEQCSPGTALW
jgi:hypothetical protein